MTESSARSMRAISILPWVSVMAPRVRASRQSCRVDTSMRGRGSTGCGPAWAATSSNERPLSTCFSNSVARAFMRAKRTALSMMMVQDQTEAAARPIMTVFTTQSAVMNSSMGFSSEASAGGVMRRPWMGPVSSALIERADVAVSWRRV
ncbi:hypothetical protein D3C80_972860 [compost metagenome]